MLKYLFLKKLQCLARGQPSWSGHKSVQMMETRVGEESKEALETKTAQVES